MGGLVRHRGDQPRGALDKPNPDQRRSDRVDGGPEAAEVVGFVKQGGLPWAALLGPGLFVYSGGVIKNSSCCSESALLNGRNSRSLSLHHDR